MSLACGGCRASAEKRVLLTVDRAGKQIVLPVFPALGADGEGRLGVQLSGNATIRHRVARGPIEAASMAGREFTRLFNSVTKGLLSTTYPYLNAGEALRVMAFAQSSPTVVFTPSLG